MRKAPRIKWHPLLSLVEPEQRHWALTEEFGRHYGDIALVRRNGDLGYRALVMGARATAPVEAIFASSLRQATEAVHRYWIASHALDADRKPSHI